MIAPPTTRTGRSLAAVFVIAAAVALTGNAYGGDRVTAGEAFARQGTYILNAQFDRLYNELAPVQQKIVSRDLFLRCSKGYDLPPLTLESWKQIDSLHVRVLIPGTGRRMWTTAVTLRVKFKNKNTGQHESATDTAHMLLVRGHWRWILDSPAMTAFKHGRCPKQ